MKSLRACAATVPNGLLVFARHDVFGSDAVVNSVMNNLLQCLLIWCIGMCSRIANEQQ